MTTLRATLVFVTPVAGKGCRNDRAVCVPALKSRSSQLCA